MVGWKNAESRWPCSREQGELGACFGELRIRIRVFRMFCSVLAIGIFWMSSPVIQAQLCDCTFPLARHSKQELYGDGLSHGFAAIFEHARRLIRRKPNLSRQDKRWSSR